MTPEQMLDIAVEEARKGLAEGGIPIGAALFGATGSCSGGPVTTAACRMTIRRCTPRPTPSARRAVSAATDPR